MNAETERVTRELASLHDEIRSFHTNMGEPCENCKHRFPYDDCVSCGESWPCSTIRMLDLWQELRQTPITPRLST